MIKSQSFERIDVALMDRSESQDTLHIRHSFGEKIYLKETTYFPVSYRKKMDPGIDDNPFADPSIRQATAQTLFVHRHLNYFSIILMFLVQINNPYGSIALLQIQPWQRKSVLLKYCFVRLVKTSEFLQPTPPVAAAQQVPSYASSTTAIASGQQGAEKYGSNTARIDLTQLERQQAELEQREKRLTERERELRNAQMGGK